MRSPLLERFLVLERMLDGVAERTGQSVAWLTLAMMVVTCLVVTMRYAFNSGSVALQESVIYMHGIVFLLAIAFTLKQDAHVRVDIFYQKCSARTRAIIDLVGTLLFLFPVTLFIGFVSIDYVLFSWRIGEGSAEPGGLPGVYLLKTLILAMVVSLLAQGCAELLRSVRRIIEERD